MELIFEKSRAGRSAGHPPQPGLPVPELPSELRRETAPRLPEISEPELVRHFTALADRTFGIDTGFYPLGSCTMKHNPRVNEQRRMLPGFRDLHPLSRTRTRQGALELMWRLQDDACRGRGPARDHAPAGGRVAGRADRPDAHARVLRRPRRGRARHDRHRRHAHGTNPASVTMAGYKLAKVQTRRARQRRPRAPARDGERAHRRADARPTPRPSASSTRTSRMSREIFHDAGALLYYDGANLNAVCGISARATWASTSSTTTFTRPFRSRTAEAGRAAGRLQCELRSSPFSPSPQVVRAGDGFRLDSDRPKSIGHVRGFTGRSASSCARTRSCARTARICARCRRRRCSTRTTCCAGLKDAFRAALRPPLHARVRPVRTQPEARARDHGARRRQAIDGLRLASAHRLLPARSSPRP